MSSYVPYHDFLIREQMGDLDSVAIDEVYLRDGYRLSEISNEICNARLVVDIGAHIGSFSRKVLSINPKCRVVAVECCPENIPVLTCNLDGRRAEVIHAACTYIHGDVMLANSLMKNGKKTLNTQQTAVITGPSPEELKGVAFMHWVDNRPLRKVTLSEISGGGQIDLLKLDCEGSEYSILSSPESLLARMVVGEWHDNRAWERFQPMLLHKWSFDFAIRSPWGGIFRMRRRL